jgi:hypothetical protein
MEVNTFVEGKQWDKVNWRLMLCSLTLYNAKRMKMLSIWKFICKLYLKGFLEQFPTSLGSVNVSETAKG